MSHPHSLAARPGRNRSPFARQDIGRIAEFFDGNMERTYELCRTTWLPDAESNLHKLATALSRLNMHDVMFLCDHLREGARCVGARTFMTQVKDIECAARDRDWPLASRLATDITHYVREVHAWLGEHFEAAANAMALAPSQASDDESDSHLRRHLGASRRGRRRL